MKKLLSVAALSVVVFGATVSEASLFRRPVVVPIYPTPVIPVYPVPVYPIYPTPVIPVYPRPVYPVPVYPVYPFAR